MSALLWQTALLLLVAYFLGAWVACMIRRTFFADYAKVRSDETLQLAVHLPGPPPAASGPAPSPRPRPQTEPIRPNVAAPAVAAPPAARRQAATPTPAPPLLPLPSPPATSRPVSSVATPAAPGATAMQRPQAQTSTPPRQGQRSPTPVATHSPGAAGLSAPRVAPPTSRPSPVAAPAPASAKGAAQTPAAPARSAPAATGPSTSQPGDDLTRIRGIDPALQARLNGLGVRRYADIADWRAPDVSRVSTALACRGRIERENWIEQAQILANGGETFFSSRQRRGERAAAGPTPNQGASRVPDGAAPAPAATATGPALAPVEMPAAAPGLAVTTEPGAAAAMHRPITGLGRDNLQLIKHVNAEVEKLLKAQGVSRYEQIAAWGPSDVLRFDKLLGQSGRIGRENWMEQAQILAWRGETAYSREFERRAAELAGGPPRPTRLAESIRSVAATSASDPARAARADVAAPGSVRSVTERGADTAGAAATVTTAQGAPAGGAGRGPQRDDLKRIRGVGVLLETKLNAMGITSYEQIANWSPAEIDRVKEVLDVTGRIERENWIEQARILASGGQTEFSRRIDRGAIEPSVQTSAPRVRSENENKPKFGS